MLLIRFLWGIFRSYRAYLPSALYPGLPSRAIIFRSFRPFSLNLMAHLRGFYPWLYERANRSACEIAFVFCPPAEPHPQRAMPVPFVYSEGEGALTFKHSRGNLSLENYCGFRNNSSQKPRNLYPKTNTPRGRWSGDTTAAVVSYVICQVIERS